MKQVLGCLSGLLSLVMYASAVELSEALDAPALVWTTGGDASWFGQTALTSDGMDAAQSGAITENQQSWLETEVTGPGLLNFKWKVSSEEGYDYLRFRVDGVEQGEGVSGITDWMQESATLGPGTHVLRWEYAKDASDSYNSDCGWVDEVVWLQGTPFLAAEPRDQIVVAGNTATFCVQVTSDLPFSCQWYMGATGDTLLPIADATNAVFSLPSVTGDTSCWIRVSNAIGSVDSRTVKVRVGFPVYTLEELKKVGSGTDGWTLDAAYVLMSNLDASATASWNDEGTDETVLEGFKPIGKEYVDEYDPDLDEWVYEEAEPFLGAFEGNGHVIERITVNREGQNGVGLFGKLGAGAVVQNLGVVGAAITGRYYVGGLCGASDGCVVRCFAAGVVKGQDGVGGLVGSNRETGEVLQCYALAELGGGAYACVGGLTGDNQGRVAECYAVPKAGGLDKIGGLVGETYNGGSVEEGYWDVVDSGLDASAGGEGKTSEQMRQQTTFVGWDFDVAWGIQEGVGAPYLRLFAAEQAAHETAPSAVSPADLSSVTALRPVMTAEVAVAGCAYASARWQIAASPDFADARDWMGLEADDNVLQPPFSSRVPIELALEGGKTYYWRMRVLTWYGMWSDWSVPVLFQIVKPSDALVAGRDELGVWTQGLFSHLWRTNYLFSAHDDFTVAVGVSGMNYEARILRAVTTLAKLSEDSELRGLLADFGYRFDEGIFAFTGRFAEAASPLPNDTVDRIVGQALPAIDSAAADLAVIPENWTGTVALTPDVVPVDETVYVDVGDVFFARAALAGARAVAETAQAYDLPRDYSKTTIVVSVPVASQLAVALDGDESEWANTPAVLFGEKSQLEYAKIARSATQAYVLVRMAEGLSARDVRVEIAVGDTDRAFWFYDWAEGQLMTDESDSASAIKRGNVIEIVYDLQLADQSKEIRLSKVEAEYPTQIPSPAPALAVTADGDATEWAGVPASSLSGDHDVVSNAKIVRSGTHICVLITLVDGRSFDGLDYFYADVSTLSGNSSFRCSIWSEEMVYASHGEVLEIIWTIPESLRNEDFYLRDVYVELASPAWDSEYLWFDWDIRLDSAVNAKKLQSVNRFLADHPVGMNTVRNPGNLPSAKASLREALTLVLAADTTVTGRTDGVMHFIEYDPARSDEQAEARRRLHEVLDSLDTPQHVEYGGRSENVSLGAFFGAPFVTRALLPRLTEDDEIVVGTFPDPTFNGVLPDMGQASWVDELRGVVPMVNENAFTMDGQSFTTGGYAFWEKAEGSGVHTDIAQSGVLTNDCQTSWVETSFTGPGTLTFSSAVCSKEWVDLLSVYVDGVRQTGSLSGEVGWGPRQLVLTGGVHRVRWVYMKNEGGGTGADGGMIDGLTWASSAPTSTDTPVRVPYAWLDGFTGMVQAGDYDSAAKADQDGDGKKTWEEFVMGTCPTNAASVFLATLGKQGPSLTVGWTPDLGSLRVYTVEGKACLSDEEWGPTNAASRFFHVKVQMP